MVMHHHHRTTSIFIPTPFIMPYCPPPADVVLLALARRLAQATDDRAVPGDWTWLDGSRIRAQLHANKAAAALPWNLAYFDLKEGNLLLAWLDADTLVLQLSGEMRGLAALNFGDALLEGLELGCSRFVLDFAQVAYLGQDALHLVAMLWRELGQEGRQQQLLLQHAAGFPELRRAAPSCF